MPWGQRIRILHISDLHARGLRDGKRAWKRKRVLGDAWRRNLEEIAADGQSFDLVAFTGDVADWGLADEYAAATPFVIELLEHLHVPRDRFFVVPGNHDVHRRTEAEAWAGLRKGIWSVPREVSEWMADSGDAPFRFAPEWRDAVLERERAFWGWVEHDLGRPELLPSHSPHGRLGYGVSIPVGRAHAHIMGLDSAWLAGDDADAGKLWLTEDQLGLLAHDEQGQPLRGFRLALVHHPVSDLADAEDTARLLGDTVDLVLRGHQHTPVARSQSDPDRTYRELAAGCLYAGTKANRYPNAFQVIDAMVDTDGRPLRYDIRFRAWSPNGHWHDDGALYREARQGRLTWHVVRSEISLSSPVPQPLPPPARARPRRVPNVPSQYEAGQVTVDAAVYTLPKGPIPEPAPLPPGSRMPMARNPLFVGRSDELRTLAEALQVEHTTAIGQLASVMGMGGIGKSQLAAEFAHRYGQFFRGGVFWLSFANGESVPAEFAQCGGPEHLGLWTIENAPDIATQVATVRKIFAEPVPRLLVFDNCEDEELLDEWRPKSGGCRVLVTSRRQAFSDALGVHTLAVDVLPRAESLALLRSFGRDQLFDPADDAVLDEICAELGDLPLALHLAGSFLARYRNGVKPATYLAQLREQELLGHASLQGYGTKNSPTGHDLHVGRTFALSWDRLDPAVAVDAMARDLLERAACLAPGKSIPRALLMAVLSLPQSDPDILAFEDALHRLLDLGLLSVSEHDTYTMHQLVSAFIVEVCLRSPSHRKPRARRSVEQVFLDEARRVNESGYPAQLISWQPHLRVATDRAQERGGEWSARLCKELGYHLYQLGDYQGAHPYYTRALAIYEKQLGPYHPHTATSMIHLALLLRDQGLLAEAQSLSERALAIYEKQRGSEHRFTAAALANLAFLLRAQGAYAEARPLFERALDIYEKQLGPDHPGTATILCHLAALFRDQGMHAEARPLFERALDIYEKQLGPNHPYMATSLSHLAALLQHQGAHEEARPLFERALDIYEKQLGPNHPYTATGLNNLALLLKDQGLHAEAGPLFERARAIREATLSPNHARTQGMWDNMPRLSNNEPLPEHRERKEGREES